MSLLDTTAFTQPAKPVVPAHVSVDVTAIPLADGARWEFGFEPDEIATTLAEMGRHLNGKTESATLLVGQQVGRLLRADYAALERRVMVHYAGDLDWPSRVQSGDPVKACTRLMQDLPVWETFEAAVIEHPAVYRHPYEAWVRAYDRMAEEWGKFVHVMRTTDPETEIRDVRGKRPKFDPVPHQTTGAEALAMWTRRQ